MNKISAGLRTIREKGPTASPLGVSIVLENIRQRLARLIEEKELLGDGRRPETRRLRGQIELKIRRLERKRFAIRQMAFDWGRASDPDQDLK